MEGSCSDLTKPLTKTNPPPHHPHHTHLTSSGTWMPLEQIAEDIQNIQGSQSQFPFPDPTISLTSCLPGSLPNPSPNANPNDQYHVNLHV